VMARLPDLFQKEAEISFLSGSLLLFIAGIASHYYFLQIDYFNSSKSEWSTPAGYTKWQFVHLVIGTYLIPVAIILMSIFISKSSKQTSYTSMYKLATYTSLSLISLLGCAVSAYYSSEVLGCLGYFCIGSSEKTPNSSGLITVNLVFFTICLYFAIILMRATFTIGVAKYHESNTVVKPTYSQLRNDITSNNLSASNLEALRTSEKAHRKAYRYSTMKEMVLIALVFAVLYPIMIVACTLLPTWWSGFTRYKIQMYQAQVPSKAYGAYWMLTLNDDVIMKLFPDIAIYFGAIYIVSLLGLWAQYWPPLKRFFHTRLTSSMCIGQALLAVMLVALLGVSWYYWFSIHVYENNSRKIRTTAELAARSFGQLGNIVIGLLVLPVAKNGVWSRVFGVSWEGMIIYHKILGYTFVLLIFSHMISWWVVFSQKGSFPSDIFAVPMIYHSDNFTVPLGVLTALFMFIIMGGLTFHLIRRKNYELFYYFHLFSGIIFLTVLW
jgi:Ferric reductase like transmembrane component